MSPQVFRELILPHLSEVASEICLPWIFHSDGGLKPVLRDLLSLSMDGLHPIEPECMSLKQLKDEVGSEVCLVGNISVDLLGRGTPDEVRQDVERCFRQASPHHAYMISSSNSIPAYAIPENVLAMSEMIHKMNREVFGQEVH